MVRAIRARNAARAGVTLTNSEMAKHPQIRCPYCGEQLPITAIRCAVCGEDIQSPDAAAIAAERVELEQAAPEGTDFFVTAFASGAQLRGAFLNGADLFQADLSGADLHVVWPVNVPTTYASPLWSTATPAAYASEVVLVPMADQR